MGLVLAAIAEVSVASVTAGLEAIADVEASVAIETAVESAVEGAAAGAAEAAEAAGAAGAGEAAGAGVAAEAAETAAWVLEKVSNFCRIIQEFCEIDAVFKAAKAVLESLPQDPETSEKCNRLQKSLSLLLALTSKMEELGKWLKDHKDDSVNLDNFNIPLESGLLSSFMKPLLKAVPTLQKLSEQISSQNLIKQAITDTQLTMMHRGIICIVGTLKSLAEYRETNGGKLPVLMSIPVNEKEVQKWMEDLGCEGDAVLSLLKNYNYN